jgi:protein-S-isoprenylcysteine O-methyltransferase Ste14
MYELSTFIVLSACLAYLSRASLRVPRSHGFYRFFAAEFTLALVVLNIDHWFLRPLSFYQLVSWLLLAVSVVLVLSGASLLKILGKPDSGRKSDVPLAGLEKTTSLVCQGVYRYIRHPLYASGFYGAWGVFFKDPSWPGALLAMGATGFWVAAARIEEAECIRAFGSPYRDYIRHTKMFVPYLF